MQGDFRIGEWLVQPQLNQISGNGKSTRVEPKAMQVLVALAEHSTEVVSKEKLIRAVWAETFVTDDVLTRCISELRKAFDDDARESRVIETIPKSGYRLLLSVSRPQSSKAMRVALVATATIVIASGFLAWRAARSSPSASPAPPGRVMLAVLPFVNLSNDPEQEYFSDGLTEETIAQLGGLNAERLGVIARTSVMQYKGTKKTVQDISRELRVDYLLESSVQRAGDRVRITTQLIRASDQTHVWAESYERDLRDILSVRREVAQAVAAQVPILLTPQQRAQLGQTKPLQGNAYQSFLLGRFHARRSDSEDIWKAIRYFEQATARDPAFAPAYAGLAGAYLNLARRFSQMDARAALPKVKAAVERALQLDERLPEAHAIMASMKFDLEFEWTLSALHFRRALDLNPNNAEVLEEYSGYLALMGREDEAVAIHKRAIELDPLNTDLNIKLGWTLFYARRFDEGIAHHEKLLAIDPKVSQLSHYLAGWHYSLKGMHAEAIRECEIAESDSLCAYVYAAAGRRAEALRYVRKLEAQLGQRAMKADLIAIAYIPLGEKNRALALLERAYRERSTSLAFLKADPIFDPLRNDARFKDIMRRMNFPE